MNILVTGKNGYLSNRISNYFSKLGHKVNQISLRNNSFLCCNYYNIDVVIHIAGVTPQKKYSSKHYYDVNYELTKKFYNTISTNIKKCHFIYLSSMAIYGSSLMKKNGKAISLYTKPNPKSDYGKSKLLAENFLLSKNDLIKKTIIRVPTLYDDFKTEYFYFYKKIMLKTPLLPKMNLNTKRSLLHIDNLCFLLNEIINKNIQEKIILACDKYIPNINDIFKKISSDLKIFKKESIFFGLLINYFYWIHPIFKNFVGSAFYDEKTSILIDKKNIYDLNLNKET